MITLYDEPHSRSLRVRWLLEELGAPYHLSSTAGLDHQDELDALRQPLPGRHVPVIRHEGTLITGSIAIVLSLTDRYPDAGLAPIPSALKRGSFLAWLAWSVAVVEPVALAMATGQIEGDVTKQQIHKAVQRRIEAALQRTPFVLGERFSAADLLLSCVLAPSCGTFPTSATIAAYVDRCRARPAWLRAQASNSAVISSSRLIWAV